MEKVPDRATVHERYMRAEVMSVQICRSLEIRMAYNLRVLDIYDLGYRRSSLNIVRFLWYQVMVTLTSSCCIPAFGGD